MLHNLRVAGFYVGLCLVVVGATLILPALGLLAAGGVLVLVGLLDGDT